jgi:hypothetical protein
MLGCVILQTDITLNTFAVEAWVQSEGIQGEILLKRQHCDPFL